MEALGIILIYTLLIGGVNIIKGKSNNIMLLLFDTKVNTFFKKIIGQEPRLDPAVTPTLSIST